MNIEVFFEEIHRYVSGWPLIIYVLASSIICTIALKFLQFRYFKKAWHYILDPSEATGSAEKTVHMSPVQAFVSTLSANLGNGSIAGMATALYSGGPGATLWVFIIGFFLMVIRFAEVFLSIYYANKATTRANLGGPMLYLRYVPGGHVLSYIYGFITLIFGFLIGNAMQTNSISLSLKTTWDIPEELSAVALFIFIFYILAGGASRIARASERIVPLKVATFCISSCAILIYHYDQILPALQLIWHSAFSPVAFAGGAIGFSVQQAMLYGITRSIMATETGLGTAAILFSSTGSEEPVKDGIMSMLSTFISTIVCCFVALCIITSGVTFSGLSSTALTIAAFDTVFGQFGGWIVTFLSVSFGAGVLVAYAYVAREVWFFLTGGHYSFLFNVVYCAVAFTGALVDVNVVWNTGDVVVAIMLFINLYGIVCLIPVIRRALAAFEGTREQNNA